AIDAGLVVAQGGIAGSGGAETGAGGPSTPVQPAHVVRPRARDAAMRQGPRNGMRAPPAAPRVESGAAGGRPDPSRGRPPRCGRYPNGPGGQAGLLMPESSAFRMEEREAERAPASAASSGHPGGLDLGRPEAGASPEERFMRLRGQGAIGGGRPPSVR